MKALYIGIIILLIYSPHTVRYIDTITAKDWLLPDTDCDDEDIPCIPIPPPDCDPCIC